MVNPNLTLTFKAALNQRRRMNEAELATLKAEWDLKKQHKRSVFAAAKAAATKAFQEAEDRDIRQLEDEYREQRAEIMIKQRDTDAAWEATARQTYGLGVSPPPTLADAPANSSAISEAAGLGDGDGDDDDFSNSGEPSERASPGTVPKATLGNPRKRSMESMAREFFATGSDEDEEEEEEDEKEEDEHEEEEDEKEEEEHEEEEDEDENNGRTHISHETVTPRDDYPIKRLFSTPPPSTQRSHLARSARPGNMFVPLPPRLPKKRKA